jgi:hypothetical protein
MASTQAMCTSFKSELLQGLHQFGPNAGTVTIATRGSVTAPVNDVFKVALFLDAATLGAGTAAYSTTSECTASGSYALGGSQLVMVAPAVTSTTAYVGPASAATLQWTTFTATGFSAALLYNSTQGNRAVSVHTFASQSITAGTFTITFPTNDATTGLLRFV